MIYIFGGAHDHGLSRGNAIFETRRSRKAIIPKAVLIKAQPRYIVAMPHTPTCPTPLYIAIASYPPFFRPLSSLSRGHPLSWRTQAHPPPIRRCPNFFFRDSSPYYGLQIARRCSLSLPLSFLHSLSPLAIFYPRLVALFLTMVITLLRNSFQFIRNI